MDTKTVKEHNSAQDEDGIHRTVFQEDVFFNAFNIADGQLADDDGADTVSDQDERDREGEGKCSQNAVDREGRVDDFEVEDLADI